MTDFDDAYFQQFYASPEHRNPDAKLRWYESRVLDFHQDRPIRLLDVGCGLGAFATHMSRNDAATVTATDVSAHAIARNQEADPAVIWIQAAAVEEVAPPASFDVITAWDVLEHLSDPATALDAFDIMLVDRGSLMVVVPVYDGVSGPIIRRLDKDPTHVNKWSRHAWLDLISTRFVVKDWIGIIRYPLPFTHLHVAHRALRRISPAVFVAASKVDHK